MTKVVRFCDNLKCTRAIPMPLVIKTRFKDWKKEIKELKVKNGALKGQCDILQKEYDFLQKLNNSLQNQIESLKRKIWGKSSERFISPDPLQRRIDFEGLDVLPEEKVEAEKAAEQVNEYKEIRVKVKEKKKQVRVALPEFLPRVEEHIYPQNIDIASNSWTELPSEIVEKQVVTAPMPILPHSQELCRCHPFGGIDDKQIRESTDSAVIYSLLACCKTADVNYRDWMVYVLDHNS